MGNFGENPAEVMESLTAKTVLPSALPAGLEKLPPAIQDRYVLQQKMAQDTQEILSHASDYTIKGFAQAQKKQIGRDITMPKGVELVPNAGTGVTLEEALDKIAENVAFTHETQLTNFKKMWVGEALDFYHKLNLLSNMGLTPLYLKTLMILLKVQEGMSIHEWLQRTQLRR
jgi:AraC-like DNA-binding protein